MIKLRRPRATDRVALVEHLQDGEISRWVPPIPWPYTDDDAVAFFELAESEARVGTGAHFAVVETGTEALVGGAALTNIDRTNASASIGYWVATASRGRGIATSAVRLLVGWAFHDLGLVRVWLTADTENVPSRRVAEKSGFVLEGVLRSHVATRQGRRDSALYSMLRDEWVET